MIYILVLYSPQQFVWHLCCLMALLLPERMSRHTHHAFTAASAARGLPSQLSMLERVHRSTAPSQYPASPVLSCLISYTLGPAAALMEPFGGRYFHVAKGKSGRWRKRDSLPNATASAFTQTLRTGQCKVICVRVLDDEPPINHLTENEPSASHKLDCAGAVRAC